MDLGADDYREGALLRLKEAQVLYETEQWVGSVYLAGRAVQCIFRSLLWRSGAQQHIGHSLPRLLDAVRRVGFLRESEYDGFYARVNEISVIWRNDLRFTGPRRFHRILKASKRDRHIGSKRVEGDPSKANAKRVLEIAEWITQRGEPVCRRR